MEGTPMMEVPMRPGETVQVVKGEHEGKKAKMHGSDGFFCHIQLLTRSGRKQEHGLVTLHKSDIAPLEDQRV
jgi:hypothetical protein